MSEDTVICVESSNIQDTELGTSVPHVICIFALNLTVIALQNGTHTNVITLDYPKCHK